MLIPRLTVVFVERRIVVAFRLVFTDRYHLDFDKWKSR